MAHWWLLLVAVVIQCAAFWDAIAVQAIRQAIVVKGNLRHMGILMARSTQHMRVGSTMYCPPNIIKKVGLR